MVIDSKLAKFINVNEHITKAEVMKHISSYIKDHNLQTENDKRQFVPNKQLTKIFGMDKGKVNDIFKINKYITQYLSPAPASS